MRIEILKISKNEASFLIEGVKSSFVSALRRIILSEIPTMAIELVAFKKNDSVLNDEIIAHRLGLIPLTFDKKAYNLPEECSCKGKGCSRCRVKLTLKKKGPCMIYSEDLKSDAKDVKPVYDKIPIVELLEDQELEFEATAQLGFGKVHAKWQGGIVGYKNVPQISFRGSADKKIFESCPRKVFKIEGEKLKVDDPLKCNYCMQCVKVSNGNVEVKPIEDEFVFNVETASGLTVEELISGSATILREKLKKFSKNLKKLK